eukprot:5542493-Alexandrium_andersonii.AAC.1
MHLRDSLEKGSAAQEIRAQGVCCPQELRESEFSLVGNDGLENGDEAGGVRVDLGAPHSASLASLIGL